MAEEDRGKSFEALLSLLGGYRLSQAAYVVVRLGVADRLADGPKEAVALARELEVDPDRLFRVLRALASAGLFTLDARGRVGLTATGELLRSDVPGSLAAFALLQGEEGYRAFAELLHTVRTGETAFDHVFGMGHFDYLGAHPEASRVFHRAMSSSLGSAGDPLHGFDLAGHRVVVDVGGGRGTLLAGVLGAHPHLRGILFDLPSAVAGAPPFLAAAGVRDRVEIRTGSAFDQVPPGGDVYVLSRVLHDWPDAKAELLLRNCRKAVGEDGVVLVREIVLPEGTVPLPQVQRDLMMMVMNGGRERTEREWRELLGRCGFALVGVRAGQGPDHLLVAEPC